MSDTSSGASPVEGSSGAWQRTSPYAVLFFLGRIVQALAKNAIQSLAPFLAFIYAFEGDVKSKLGIAVGVGAVLLVTGAILRYLFFRFRIEDEQIRIREGVFKKKQLDIKYDRVQGINTEQSFLFRLLGLYTVKFDTAGSSGDEGSLPAVSESLAEDLKSRLKRQPKTVESEVAAPTQAPPDTVLLSLSLGDMVRIGLADRRALLLLALAGPVFEQMGESTQKLVANYAEDAAEQLASFGWILGVAVVIALVVFFVGILAIGSIFAAILRYHDFQLSTGDDRIKSVGGLMTRHESSMRIGKVQVLRLKQGVVLRLFGRFRMYARQASSNTQKNMRRNFVVPLTEIGFAQRFRDLLFGDEGRGLSVRPDDARFAQVSPYFMRARFVLFGIVPTIAVTILSLVEKDWSTFSFLLLVPLGPALVFRAWRRLGYLHDNDGLVKRSGILGWRVDTFLFRKVQRVTVTQSFFQRRRGIATLRIYLASGSVRLPYIEVWRAAELRDYILFKVESSQRAWH